MSFTLAFNVFHIFHMFLNETCLSPATPRTPLLRQDLVDVADWLVQANLLRDIVKFLGRQVWRHEPAVRRTDDRMPEPNTRWP